MFYCKFVVILSLIGIGSSVPARRSLINEPQRCCGVKEFNSKITVSSETALPSGQSYASYVVSLVYESKMTLFIFSYRDIIIFHIMKIVDWSD